MRRGDGVCGRAMLAPGAPAASWELWRRQPREAELAQADCCDRCDRYEAVTPQIWLLLQTTRLSSNVS